MTDPIYFHSLNPRQREAVETTEGPLLVLAGAGSGKTKMLTSRIAYLMECKQVPPTHILAVTFTNKAAQEMRERIERNLSERGSSLGFPEIGTFHSVCVRLLRREMARTPFTKPFVIFDDSDQLQLLKSVLKKLGLDDKRFSPKSVQGTINRLKCDAISPEDLHSPSFRVSNRSLIPIFEEYQKELFANNALDFGEILCLTYRLIRDDAEVRRKFQARTRYLHVDEYQDTNRVQYLLLSLLAGKKAGGHENLCVVGDEDQSIYKWRGADIRNILDFEQDFPGAKIIKLEQNYRSTQTIITAASHVIRNNRERKDKMLWTENSRGEPIAVVRLPDERAEAEMVVAAIQSVCAGHDALRFGDCAVFYRTHAQSRQFEDILRRENIPYQIVGGLRFYDRKEIKDILAYFKLIFNPSDSVSLKRVINVPARAIGKVAIEHLDALQAMLQARTQIQSQRGHLLTLWDALVAGSNDPALLPSPSLSKKFRSFLLLMERLQVEQPRRTLTELYHLLLDETHYVQELRQEGTEEALARIENLEEFHTLLQEFEEEHRQVPREHLLLAFLEQTTLSSDIDQAQFGTGAVNLMTLHSSKGLEFPAVFLVGMEEGLFPSLRPWEEAEEGEIEEERRLCYVGMTRAERKLTLSHVVVRRIWGNIHYPDPARFLDEIPEELVRRVDFAHGPQAGRFRLGSSRGEGFAEQKTLSIPSFTQSHLKKLVGSRLAHPEYGSGRILSQEGSGPDEKIWVEFGSREKRKFLLRYVREYVV